MPSADPLVEVADRLYALQPADFTAARDAAAKEARDDKELAGRVKKLKRPSIAGWAVNLLVRREGGQIEQVLALGESLRAAAESLDGDELRALTRQRRQLTAALTGTARSLAREYDVRLTDSVADQVEGTLNAALLDPVAAEVVRSGLVLAAFSATGLSEVDVAAVCAVPDAVGAWTAKATEPEHHEPPTLTVVPDTHLKIGAARERLDRATEAVERAQADVAEATGSVERLQARRLQLREEIDELQRRLAELEEDVDSVDEDIDDAEAAREEAAGALDDSRGERDAARAALDDLTASPEA
jgi:uncharacterized protein YdcH (DUF465 family)